MLGNRLIEHRFGILTPVAAIKVKVDELVCSAYFCLAVSLKILFGEAERNPNQTDHNRHLD